MLKLRPLLAAALALFVAGAVQAKPAPPKDSPQKTVESLIQGIRKGDKAVIQAQFDWEAMVSEGPSASREEIAKTAPLMKAVTTQLFLSPNFKSLALDSVKTKGNTAQATTTRVDPQSKKKVAGPTFGLHKANGKWLIREMGAPAAAPAKTSKE